MHLGGHGRIRNRARHEHEDEDGGDALEGRHEDLAENADVLRGRGPDEGERGAQNERDENLPDERAVNDRLGKPEDAAKTLGHDGKLLLCDGGGPRTGVRRTRAALAPAV